MEQLLVFETPTMDCSRDVNTQSISDNEEQEEEIWEWEERFHLG